MNGADLPAPGQPANTRPQYATQSGAIQALAFDPANFNVLLAASPNGGIFRSTDGGLSWTATTDNQGSLSIASLNFDPTDTSGKTVVAGVGITSAGATYGFLPYFDRSRGGVLDGILISNDGGATWTNPGANLPSLSVQGIAVRGSVIMAGVLNEEGNWMSGAGVEAGSGLYRSTDGGHTFSGVSALPTGGVSALVGDPSNPNRLYAAVTTAASGNSNDIGTSVWTTADGGVTWSKVFSSTNAAGTINSFDPTMLRLAAGPGGSVAVAVVDGFTGTVTGLFLSKDQGSTWNNLSIALTPGSANGTGQENGSGFGNQVDVLGNKPLSAYYVSPIPDEGPDNLSVNPGGQASIHSVVSIDPNNPDIVYLAGDRQDLPSPTGAVTYSGAALSAQLNSNGTVTYAALTDNYTADNSTYHPDTRAMAFTPSGTLLVGSDGGVYSRTSPSTSTGVWRGLNTGRQALEIYDLSLDPHSGLLAVAAQDNGTAIQSPTNPSIYNQVAGGDGTVAPVNGVTDPNSSWTYVACQYLCGGPTRVQTDLHGNFTAATPVDVYYSVDGTAAGIIGIDSSNVIFVPKLKLNNIDPSYQALGVQPGIIVAQDNVLAPSTSYASSPLFGYSGPGAYTILPLNFAGFTGYNQALDFGTRDNEWALLAGGGNYGGHHLFLSQATSYANMFLSLAPVTSYTGYATTAVLFDPRSQNRFFATDTNILYSTVDGGATGIDLTSKLPADFIRPQSLGFISTNGVNELLVGGLNDTANVGSPLVIADSDASGNLSNWRRFGTGLPNAIVTVLDYVPSLDELAIGTFGRGAFQMFDVTSNFADATVLQFGLANNNSTPDASVLTDGTVGSRPLIKYGTGLLTIGGTATYTGGTTIEAGAMQLGTGGASGSILGNVAFCSSGAACDTSNNKYFVFDRSDTYTFAGNITGPGQVWQAGSGTTVLTGTSTYSGPTTVAGGTLKVDGSLSSSVTVMSGTALAGNGSTGAVNVLSGGYLIPGDPLGTLSVNGGLSLPAGTTLTINASSGGLGSVSATGSATVNGTIALNIAGMPYWHEGGVIVKASSITASGYTVPNTLPAGVLYPVVALQHLTGFDALSLQIEAASYSTVFTPRDVNEGAIGNILDGDRNNFYGALQPVYQTADLLSGDSLADVFDMLKPNQQLGFFSAGRTALNLIGTTISQRLSDLRFAGGSDSTGMSFNGLDSVTLGMAQNLTATSPLLLASNLGTGQEPISASAAPASVTPAQALGEKWGGFLTGSVLNGTTHYGVGQDKNMTGYLVMGGLDTMVAPRTVLGAAVSVTEADADLPYATGKSTVKTYQGTLYGTWSDEARDLFINGFAGYGGVDASANRFVNLGGTVYQAHSAPGGSQAQIGMMAGTVMPVYDWLTIYPEGGFEYDNFHTDAYTETGSVIATQVAAQSADQFLIRVGGEASADWQLSDDATVHPRVHAFWVGALSQNQPQFTAAFAAAPSGTASFVSLNDTSWLEMGLGVDAKVGDGVTLGISYDATLDRADASYGAVTGRIRILF